jgi:hypothetical protein
MLRHVENSEALGANALREACVTYLSYFNGMASQIPLVAPNPTWARILERAEATQTSECRRRLSELYGAIQHYNTLHLQLSKLVDGQRRKRLPHAVASGLSAAAHSVVSTSTACMKELLTLPQPE